MQGIEIPSEFINIPWESLERIANWHEKMAKICRARSQKMQKIELSEKICQERVDYMADSYKLVLHYLSRGYNSTESAISAAARDLDLTEDCVLGWWKNWKKNSDQATRTERNRVVVDLVRLGITNKDIAKRLEIHPNTVTRAINEHLFKTIRPSDRARLYKRRKVKK